MNQKPEKNVRAEGLEPPCLAAPDTKSGTSTNFATPAFVVFTGTAFRIVGLLRTAFRRPGLFRKPTVGKFFAT